MKSIFVRASVLMCMAAFSFAMAQVDLGGTVVPKDKFIVYLGVGHFNMAGRVTSNTDSVIHPRCWNFKIDGTINPAAWIPAKPVICSLETSARGNGPWMSWLKTMAERHPDYYFGVITNPAGANALSDDYVVGKSRYNELVTAAQQWSGKCTFGGLLMMLGASSGDRGSPTDAAAFATNAVNMITGIRTALQAPHMPLYVNQWECKRDTGTYGYSLPNAQLIIQGMWSIPSLVPYAVTVPGDSLIGINNGSEIYSNLTMATMTARHIDSMHARGWFPDAASATAATRTPNANSNLLNASRVSIEKNGINQITLLISFPGMVKNPSVSIFNTKGALIQGKGLFTGSQLRYSITGGLGGFYVVKVTHDGGSFVNKIVVMQ